MKRAIAVPLMSLGLAAGLLFVGFIVSCIVTFGIWPGQMRLTAPLLCPDDRPDALIVSDTYQPTPGETTTTYTMICLGPEGQVTEVGVGRPFMLMILLHTAIIAVPILGVVGWRLSRRLRSGRGSSGSTGSGTSGVPDLGPGFRGVR